MERSRQKSEESISSFYPQNQSIDKQSIDQKSNNLGTNSKKVESVIQDQQPVVKEVELDTNTASLLNKNASIPTIQTDVPRRGRRAGMPPLEEKKEDPEKVVFPGRRLG